MPIQRVLIVEDNRTLLRSLTAALGASYPDVGSCRTLAELGAITREWQPDLVLLDVVLPDGDARGALELLGPRPVVIAMSGEADPTATFDLGLRGVRAYLPKPVTLDRVLAAIRAATEEGSDLAPTFRRAVGKVQLATVEAEARRVMIREALEQSGGSRRGAARLLGVSRQLLQYLLRGLD